MKSLVVAVGSAVVIAMAVVACGGTSPVDEEVPAVDRWLEITLEADPAGGTVTSGAMDRAVKVISDRLNRAGVVRPTVERQGADRIVVRLPGVGDAERTLELIAKTAWLEFYVVADFGEKYGTESEALASAGVETAEALPQGQRLIRWPSAANPEVMTADEYYMVKVKAPLDGSMLDDAGWDNRGSGYGYRVSLDFSPEGAQVFSELTRKMAEIGELTGTAQRLAIVLDGVVMSAPTVDAQIEGGSAEISGAFTLDEVRDLALALQTGALPVQLVVVSQRAISAP